MQYVCGFGCSPFRTSPVIREAGIRRIFKCKYIHEHKCSLLWKSSLKIPKDCRAVEQSKFQLVCIGTHVALFVGKFDFTVVDFESLSGHHILFLGIIRSSRPRQTSTGFARCFLCQQVPAVESCGLKPHMNVNN